MINALLDALVGRSDDAMDDAQQRKVMTDLDLTRLCAEAMGYLVKGPFIDGAQHIYTEDDYACWYDPLHDDAQAMALVKKFPMETSRQIYMAGLTLGSGNTANKVIVECVAKMQAAKCA